MAKKYDCIVIGAGPAGISSCLYLQQTKLKTLLIEKATPGGRIIQAPMVNNYAGYKGSGTDLALAMFENLDMEKIDFVIDEVLDINKNDEFVVTTKNEEYRSSFVITATGFVNKIIVPNQEEYLGRGVSYCALCDASIAKGKTIMVYGNGPKCAEETAYLATLAKCVYLVTDLINLSISNVETIFNAKMERLAGNRVLTSIYLNNGQKLDVDMAFLYTGYVPATSFLQHLGVLNQNGLVDVDSDGQTKIKGLYAAGGVTNNNLKQVSTAVASGAICATGIIKEANHVIR